MIKLENSLQANKTIQNLKFNNETKLVRENSGRTTDPLTLCQPAPSPVCSHLYRAPGYISWVVLNNVSWR